MKTKLTLIFVLMTSISFAQIQKNTWMIGGNGSINNIHNNTGASQSTTAIINPKIGYFLSDRIAIGSDFSISYQKHFSAITGFGQTTSYNHDFQAHPFFRYYIKTGNWNFFIQQAFGFQNNISKNKVSGNDIQIQRVFANFGLGTDIFLSRNVALEIGLNYRWFHQQNFKLKSLPFTNDFNNKNSNFMPSYYLLNIGVQLFLNHQNQENTKQVLEEYYFRKGNYHLSGQFSGLHQNVDNSFFGEPSLLLNASPNISYFITRYWKIKSGINFSYEKQQNLKSQSIGGNLGTSYYFSIWKGLYIEPCLEVSLSRSKQVFLQTSINSTFELLTVESQSNSFAGGLNLHYFLNSHVILHAGYQVRLSNITSNQIDNLIFMSSPEDFRMINGAWTFGLEYFFTPDLSLLLSYTHSQRDDDFDNELSLENWKSISSGTAVGFSYLIVQNKK